MSESLPSVYEFSADISQAEAPPPLPVGEYRASIRAIEPQTSKEGKPMAKITYYISADQYPADFINGNPDGETLSFYMMLNDDMKTRYRIRKLCDMHGVTASRTLNLPDFIGQDVMVTVTHETYQGMPQARVNPTRSV